MRIVWVNQSTLVSDAECEKIALAIEIQLATQVAPAWGIIPPESVFAADAIFDSANGDHPIFFRDTILEPEALGEHTEAPGGLQFGEIAVKPILDNGGAVLMGRTLQDPTVLAVAAHEAIELVLDQAVNLWAEAADGTLWSREGCDQVEEWNVPIVLPSGETVASSDFLLPAAFDSMAAPGSQFNYAAGLYVDGSFALKGPFTIAPGGYAVTRKPGEDAAQVFAEKPPANWRLHMKARKSGRTTRRLRGTSPG